MILLRTFNEFISYRITKRKTHWEHITIKYNNDLYVFVIVGRGAIYSFKRINGSLEPKSVMHPYYNLSSSVEIMLFHCYERIKHENSQVRKDLLTETGE